MSKVLETINGKNYERQTNPVKAIREKCLQDCCAGLANEVRDCLCPSCALYPFRFGKNPYRTKRELSDEQKEKMREVLNTARHNKM